MSKVLVIPDTHLKPKMFDLADAIMAEREVDYAVQLGDNLDDFYCFDDQYRAHDARMAKFDRDHPGTVWLWGNHELSYILDRSVTGNVFCGKEYAYRYRENFRPKAVHLDGKVVFSHAGIVQEFIDEKGLTSCKTVEELVEAINRLDLLEIWQDDSPVWARPQYDPLTKPALLDEYIQVVGHTPLEEIDSADGMISTDVFSTRWVKKAAEEKMIIIDTETGEFEKIEIDFRKRFGEGR